MGNVGGGGGGRPAIGAVLVDSFGSLSALSRVTVLDVRMPSDGAI